MNRANSRLRGLCRHARARRVRGRRARRARRHRRAPRPERLHMVAADISGRRHTRPAGHHRGLLGRVGGLHLPARCLHRARSFAASVRRAFPVSLCRSSPPTAWSPLRRCCSSRSRPSAPCCPSRAHMLRSQHRCRRPPRRRSHAESAIGARQKTASRRCRPETERYTVKRGDSLWKIAEERLGDGTRYVELVALNEAVLDGRPDFLTARNRAQGPHCRRLIRRLVRRPAWRHPLRDLRGPSGRRRAYPSIFRASRDTVQPTAPTSPTRTSSCPAGSSPSRTVSAD